jgi:hypothetical protein
MKRHDAADAKRESDSELDALASQVRRIILSDSGLGV